MCLLLESDYSTHTHTHTNSWQKAFNPACMCVCVCVLATSSSYSKREKWKLSVMRWFYLFYFCIPKSFGRLSYTHHAPCPSFIILSQSRYKDTQKNQFSLLPPSPSHSWCVISQGKFLWRHFALPKHQFVSVPLHSIPKPRSKGRSSYDVTRRIIVRRMEFFHLWAIEI